MSRRVAAVAACFALLVACDGKNGPSPFASTAPSTVLTSSTSAPPSATAPTPGALSWTPCGGDFGCARLSVPLDYAHPAARQASLALIRLPAADTSRRIGTLLTDPGGPGGSGVDFVRSAKNVFPADVRSRFDIVGFDPRGVGDSTPTVRCLPGAQLDRYFHVDPVPDNATERSALVAANRQFARTCATRTGPDVLAHVGTVDAARDMDQIRAALGETKLTDVGFSYGTYLGAVYADMFPTKLRAIVLDGAIDPSLTAEQSNLEQAKGFDRALGAFLANCAGSTGCAFRAYGPSATQLGTAFDTLMRRIDTHPLPTNGSRTVGPGEAIYGVASALYSKEQGWPVLQQALAQAEGGQGQLLLLLFDNLWERRSDGSYANLVDVLNAVTCLDKVSPRDLRTYDRDAGTFARAAPRFGPDLAYSGYTCALWPVDPVPVPRTLRATGAPPIVVVGTTRDPATPYEQAQALARMLTSGVLLTFDGDGHTAYGFNRSPCIDRVVNAYLIDLKVPAKGTVC